MIQRLGLFICGLFIALLATAQTISVKSFRCLETDMDARINYPQKDNNGKTCAIIKVVTTEKGFVFDGGLAGIVKTEQKAGEVWVYVPGGIKKMTLSHEKLGVLRDYFFTEAIREATCYELVLTTGRVITTVEEERIKAGFLILESEPAGAMVYLSKEGDTDNMTDTGDTTLFQRKMPYGTYAYRLTKPLYHDMAGIIEVNNAQCRQKVTLQPAFGYISVSTTPVSGATVEIEGEKGSFVTPGTSGPLASGEYRVTARAEMYATATQTVTVNDGETTPLQLTLDARFAHITINTTEGASVYLNGTKEKDGSCSFDLKEGVYDIEVKLAHHRTANKQITVEAGKPQELTLEPAPIYGSLDVVSTPIDADVYIDKVKRGVTPLSLEQLLEGDHTIEIRKAGYGTVTKHISVQENNLASVNVNLPTGKEFTITADRSDARLYIDGEYIGSSPLKTVLGYGKHEIKAEKDAYMGISDVEITETTNTSIAIKMSDASAMRGQVVITADKDVDIYYGGKKVATGEWNTWLIAGTHKIETHKEHCRAATTTFKVAAGEKRKIAAELPLPIYDKLKVNAEPEGASFYIRGGKNGKTPAVVDLPLGDHTVTFAKKHYRSQTIKATVEEDKENVVTAQLQPMVYVKPNAFFAGGGYQTGMGASPFVCVGGIIKNNMLEVEYTLSDNKKYDIGWSRNNNYYPCNYTVSRAAVRYGYRFAVARQLSLTPTLGLGWYMLGEDGDNEVSFTGSQLYAFAGMAGCRAAWHPTPWLELFAAPEFGFSLWQGNVYKELLKVNDEVPLDGFGVRGGLVFAF